MRVPSLLRCWIVDVHVLDAVSAGIITTCVITVAAFVFGAALAVPVFLLRRSKSFAVRALTRSIVEVLRAIPPVVWLFAVYFGLGASVIDLAPESAAIVGLSLITAAYMSEIYRGGVTAVDRGQWEAAEALTLSRRTTWLSVVAPQLVRVCIPAASTWAIGLLKDSSIASTIGATDLTFYAKNEANQSGAPVTPFLWAGLLYIVLTVPLAMASRVADRRLRSRVSR